MFKLSRRPGVVVALVLALSSVALVGVGAAPGLLRSSAAAPSVSVQDTSTNRFEFALIGDLAYNPAQEPLLVNVLEDLNAASSLAFVVHDGDLGGSGTQSCSDQLWALRLSQFRASAHPLIYTPGDNEWTDCHRQGYDPLERLTRLRQLIFPSDDSLGQRTLLLTRQSADPAYSKFRKNARWTYGGVTFFTLHVVGSNNNLGRALEADAEFEERTAANLVWLRQGFEHARSTNSRAVMVIQQANMWPEASPGAGQARGGFTEMRAALEQEVAAFPGPVVLVHGDSHYFRIDNPLRRVAWTGGPPLDNFTRVETFGQPSHHWLHVTVEPGDPNVFVFRPRLVEQNVGRPYEGEGM